MNIFKTTLILSLLFSLTSCLEIIDDISLNADGSGTFKYTINLSSSKSRVNSILNLDSLDGKKVPSIDEIKTRISSFKTNLENQEGVSNVTIETDYENFFFRLTCNFESVTALQDGLKKVIEDETSENDIPELEHNWLSWDGSKLVRSIPEITIKKAKELSSEDIELLKLGTYTSISRFPRNVLKCDNLSATISKNYLNVMIKTNPYALSQNSNLLENTIYLVPNKN
jgi:hypothetical protein